MENKLIIGSLYEITNVLSGHIIIFLGCSFGPINPLQKAKAMGTIAILDKVNSFLCDLGPPVARSAVSLLQVTGTQSNSALAKARGSNNFGGAGKKFSGIQTEI